MKPTHRALLTTLALAALCGSAHADQLFNLAGQIFSGTCQWSMSDADSLVSLDPIPVGNVPPNGAAGFKSFQVMVTQCTPDITTATFTFSGTSDSIDPLRYKSTGTAKGMAFELQSMDGQTVGANGTNSSRNVVINGGQAVLPLKVGYWHSAGIGVTAGTVASTAIVSMTYQ
nr:fimbrial protein [Dyella sp. ASV24]